MVRAAYKSINYNHLIDQSVNYSLLLLEISSIKTQFNEVTKDHASHISAINSTLGNITSHTNSIYASLHVDISELGVTLGRVTGEVDILQQQIANAGVRGVYHSGRSRGCGL